MNKKRRRLTLAALAAFGLIIMLHYTDAGTTNSAGYHFPAMIIDDVRMPLFVLAVFYVGIFFLLNNHKPMPQKEIVTAEVEEKEEDVPITLNKPLRVYLIVLDDGWSTFGVYADYADALAVARPIQAQIRVQYVHPKGWTPEQTWAAIPDNAEEDLKIQYAAGWKP
jgi:hypothetical protein